MNIKTVVALCSVALIGTSCASHYQLTNVNRTRLLIDNRYDVHPDAEALDFLKPYKEKVDSIMSPVVGSIARDMAVYSPESELSNLLSDILVWGGRNYNEHPDFAVYNLGGIRASFSKGVVTYGNILEVAPFENKICFLTLSGEKVLELFSEFVSQGGQGVSHGVNVVASKDGKLISAKIHGKEVDPNGSYRIATIDYLAHGNDHLDAFKAKTDFVSPQDVSNNVRFIIMNYFKEKAAQGEAVDSKVEGRFIIK